MHGSKPSLDAQGAPNISRDAATAPRVCMLVSGGAEFAGGIGRWATFMLQQWDLRHLTPPLEVVDTRGKRTGDGRSTSNRLIALQVFGQSMLYLNRLRASGQLALIHANISVRGSTFRKVIFGMLARAWGVKYVVHLHSGEFFTFYDWLPAPARYFVRRLFQQAARVVVLGEGIKAELAAKLDLRPDNVAVLYNAVPPPKYPKRETPNEVCHIVMLGRQGKRKGLPQLVEALGSDVMKSRPWRATLAGDGEVDATRADLERRGIADRVTCPGWIDSDAASRLLREADVLVLASIAEGLPISVLEALAHEVAVVTTTVGATPEIVTEGVSALMVPPNDPPALAAALARMIDDPALRERIAANGHEVFLTRLDLGVAADNLAALYHDILDGAPAAGRPA